MSKENMADGTNVEGSATGATPRVEAPRLPKMPLWKKAITVLTMFGAGATAAGCEIKTPSPTGSPTPEGLGGTPTQTFTPTEAATATQAATATATEAPTATPDTMERDKWQNTPQEFLKEKYRPTILFNTENLTYSREDDTLFAKAHDEAGDYTMAMATFDKDKQEWIWGPVSWDVATTEMEKDSTGPEYKGDWGNFLEKALPFILSNNNDYKVLNKDLYWEKKISTAYNLFRNDRNARLNMGVVEDSVSIERGSYEERFDGSKENPPTTVPEFIFNFTLGLTDPGKDLGDTWENSFAYSPSISYRVGDQKESNNSKNIRTISLPNGIYRK